MSAFKGFLYKNKRGIILVLLLLISFLGMVFSNNKVVITIDQVGLSIIFPFKYVFQSTGSFVQNTMNSVSELKKIQKDLSSARQELEQYKRIIIDFNELKNENMQLRKILELKDKVLQESVACKIVGRDPRNLYDVLIIDKGSRQGIEENMPVITYAGGKNALVGKVVEVTPFASKVITLHHNKFYIGAVLTDSNIHCIVKGSNSELGTVEALYIPRNVEVPTTEYVSVTTSGESVFYPKGIEIGRIVNIVPSKRYELYNTAEVKLAVDLSKVDYLLVLKMEYDDEQNHTLELEY